MRMNSKRGILLTTISAVIFGFAFTLGPMTYGEGGSNPLTLTLLRNLLSLPFLLAFLLWRKIDLRLTRRQLGQLLRLGLLGNAMYTLLLNMSYALVDVGVSTMITFVYPLMVMAACALLFKERITPAKAISLAVAMGGIACFFTEAASSAGAGKNAALGIVLSLVSAAFYSFYLIFLDRSGLKSEYPFKVTFYVALFASGGLFLYGGVTQTLALHTITPRAWGISVVFSLLCTVVALPMMQLGVKHIGAATTAVVSTMEPLTSLVFGALLLGEQITPVKLLASGMILAGILFLTYSETGGKRRTKRNIKEKEA